MRTRQQKRKKLIHALAEMYGVGWGGGEALLELPPPPDDEDEDDGLAEEEEEARGSDEEEGLEEDEEEDEGLEDDEEEAALGSDGMREKGNVKKVLRIPQTARRRMTTVSGWRKALWVGVVCAAGLGMYKVSGGGGGSLWMRKCGGTGGRGGCVCSDVEVEVDAVEGRIEVIGTESSVSVWSTGGGVA